MNHADLFQPRFVTYAPNANVTVHVLYVTDREADAINKSFKGYWVSRGFFKITSHLISYYIAKLRYTPVLRRQDVDDITTMLINR
jgi:hypothetical protein